MTDLGNTLGTIEKRVTEDSVRAAERKVELEMAE